MATQKNRKPAKKGEVLLIDVKGSKKAQELWMPAAWFAENLPFYKVDEPFLRRLSAATNVNPSTKSQWIPAPVKSKWPVHSTLVGIAAWFAAQGSRADSLPRQCASMKDTEAVYHIPVAMQQHYRAKGLCHDAFDASNRVTPIRILEAAKPLLKKLFSGGGAKLSDLGEEFEELDKDVMQARVLRQTEIEKLRDNAAANGRIHDLAAVEQQIRLGLLTPMRDGLHIHLKNYERQKTTDLAAASQSLITGVYQLLENISSSLAEKVPKDSQ